MDFIKKVSQYKILVALFLLATFMPLIQRNFNLFPNISTSGAEEKKELPKFTLKEFWNSKFQNELDQWLSSNIGFKEIFIRTDNQLTYSLFHQINTNYGSGIVLGANNYLFEKQYIDTYFSVNTVPKTTLQQLLERIYKIKTKLAEKNIKLLLTIGGNKASFFSEYIPKNYQKLPDFSSDFERIKSLLDQTDIDYIDTSHAVMKNKNKVSLPLYPKSGTHWSYYGACFVAEELVNKISKLLDKELKTINCDNYTVSDKPQGNDSDIAGITNIWFPEVFYDSKLAYPKKTEKDSLETSSYKPKILFIGDSFSWQILNNLRLFKIYDQLDFIYYFKTLVNDSKKNSSLMPKFFYELSQKPIDTSDSLTKDSSLNKKIFNSDIIILQANEFAVSQIGYGALEYLEQVLGITS